MTSLEIKRQYPMVWHIFFMEPQRQNYDSEWAYRGAFMKWRRKYGG